VTSKEHELKYVLDDERRLERLMALVSPDLRERLDPVLARVRARKSELQRELQTELKDEEDSTLPKAA
jgi:molybdopterin-guanine dinucleotide biosynthesis protein A